MNQWLVLDFETRSVVDLKTSSYRRYATHPSTDILCIGLKWNGRPASCYTPVKGAVLLPTDPRPIQIMEAISRGYPIVVHNAAFEKRIYYWICHKRLGWPAIPDHQWVDTMAICSYYAIPKSLEKAAKALGLVSQKDVDAGRELDVTATGKKKKAKGRHVMTQVRQPRAHGKKAKTAWMAAGKPLEAMPPIWWEDAERLNRVYGYCQVDVETQDEVFCKLGPLPPERMREWQFDEFINERGVPIDWDSLYIANDVVDKSLGEYNDQIKTLTATPAYPGGMVQTVNQRDKIIEWCDLKGYRPRNLRKETVEAALQTTTVLPEPVRQILTLRQEAGKSSLAKLETMLDLTDDDSRVRDSMAWHGAATGRKAGRGMQPHNFPRDCMDKEEAEKFHTLLREKDPFEAVSFCYQSSLMTNDPQSLPDVVSSALRSFIMPGPGKTLYISDFSNIETRNLAWVSNCRLLMEAFTTGKCPYRQFASRIYNIRAEDIAKGSEERQMGKVAVLGLGYGMGGPKFVTTAESHPYYIKSLTEERAVEIVKLYRKTYPEVTQFWSDCEAAFRQAIEEKTQVQCGKVAFGATDDWGWIVLPSGRPIWYREPRVQRVADRWREGKTRLEINYMGADIKTKQWVRRGTYGGSLVESICQAMAGDILQEALEREEANGYPVILSVHDEIVCEVFEGADFDRFHELMRVRPQWALDLPIECESMQNKRYGK